MQYPGENSNDYILQSRQGVANVKLRNMIRDLQIGDTVKLTFLSGNLSFGGEMLLVRITSIAGPEFHGKLTRRPTFIGLSKLRVGACFTFAEDHIFSILEKTAKLR